MGMGMTLFMEYAASKESLYSGSNRGTGSRENQ